MCCKDLEACKERLKKLKDTVQVAKKSEKPLTYCSNLEK